MTTYRERREAKADRLDEWADKREAKADQAYAGVEAITERIPFGQPILVGHHSERGARADQRRIESGMDAFCAHNAKASEMTSRADNIRKQAAGAIYSDDADAVERLTAKIAKLEAQRDAWKAANADYRKAHRDELKGLSPYARSQALPVPAYAITNQTANVGRLRKRLEAIQREQEHGPADRVITSRYAGTCEDCGATIERGQPIRYNRQQGARCVSCEDVA